MLHITAEDEADLHVISAHMQDALLKRADLNFDKKRRRFSLVANRFAWDVLPEKQRRRAGLRFDDVTAVKSKGLGRSNVVLSLLAITFKAKDELAGVITLAFSKGIEIRLEVACINAALDDLGGAWSASSQPGHAT